MTAADDNGKGVYSCWGFFKAFCKGKGEVDGTKIAGAAGFKCKGHFVGVKVGPASATFCSWQSGTHSLACAHLTRSKAHCL